MPRYGASIVNYEGVNEVVTSLNENRRLWEIHARAEGKGSSVTGGELLFLALASCEVIE